MYNSILLLILERKKNYKKNMRKVAKKIKNIKNQFQSWRANQSLQKLTNSNQMQLNIGRNKAKLLKANAKRKKKSLMMK